MAEDAEKDEEEKVFTAGSPVPLRALHGRTHYLAWVQASNALGAARSTPQHLDMQQLGMYIHPLTHPPTRSGALRAWTHHPEMSICGHAQAVPCPLQDVPTPLTQALLALPTVVPTLPLAIGAETTETSPPITTIHWRRQTRLENVRCEERHKATGTLAWHVRQLRSPPDLLPLQALLPYLPPPFGDAPVLVLLETPKHP